MTFLSLWSLLVCSALFVAVFSQDYAIVTIGANGSGCAPGTASTSITEGGKGFSVAYSVSASAGPGRPYSFSRRACQTTLTVNVPAGYQFALDQVTYTGSYSLQAGVRASYNTRYYFQGDLDEGRGTGAVTGASVSSGRTLPQILTPTAWSPCGKDVVLNVVSDVRISNSANRGATGVISLNSIRVPANSFVWKKC